MIPKTGVKFQTSDERLQKTVNAAEEKCIENIRHFDGYKVLIEGGKYNKIWLETQPMAGEMYAKRDLEIGLNNSLLFMIHQREDGRLPGSIVMKEGRRVPEFNKLQGFCFPSHALNMYYLLGKEEAFLERWCVTDTGEDHGLHYGDVPFWYEAETAPAGGQESTYEQFWGDRCFRIVNRGASAAAYIDGKEIFQAGPDLKIITDWEGNVRAVLPFAEGADISQIKKYKTL